MPQAGWIERRSLGLLLPTEEMVDAPHGDETRDKIRDIDNISLYVIHHCSKGVKDGKAEKCDESNEMTILLISSKAP